MGDAEEQMYLSTGDGGAPAQDTNPSTKHFSPFYWPGGPTILNFGTRDSPKDVIGNSAYAFFLIPNLWSFLLALMVSGFQLFLFAILWNDAGVISNEDFRDESQRVIGIMGAVFLLSMKVLPLFGQGMQLLGLGMGITVRHSHVESASLKKFDAKLVFVGVITLLVSIGCACVGVRFSLNKGASVFRTITNATVAVFVAGIDESMFSFMKYWARPGWLEWALAVLEKDYGSPPM
mmetsp:Transcript_23051/g.46773  ORF Transcript_23051/g.46773 Transcript_23051/m.46773 type:complete len:234 (-) Transcript_23051:212-913(-)|eukprot:CAMPEP_0183292960 /NCGR_PEP_ID=MMETSP0160_2-20130417/1831_1 /TAXON_ID=2839 ORGANISM="Odontella Sinensis, Strain Grunow 1884" /NCGR_SAMPLE_ID=MMETSP0160_2 /ASSEMBLY_ACC=CAM_ASM_000250 /LENGTH=233 /DNA_ID=CAMNT_0025454005 /DNA_START=89 /DNA_END=790 /DNA_ORIENTATION=+